MLEAHLTGRPATVVSVLDAVVLRNWGPDEFTAALTGRTIRRTSRSGKWLLAHVDAVVLAIHFGMTGSLRWAQKTHRWSVMGAPTGELRERDLRMLRGVGVLDSVDEVRALIGPQGADALTVTARQLSCVLARSATAGEARAHGPENG